MRFAVVGGGISGLTAAYLLSQRHEVTLFEAAQRIGGHTHSVDVEDDTGRHVVDMGFIVFNEKNYPGFVRLMERLGVRSQPSDMSFSMSSKRNGLEYRATSLATLFAQRSNLLRPSFHRMLFDILRFNKKSRELLRGSNGYNPTLEEYVAAGRYSRQFLDNYLVPLGASVWSADPTQMQSFPARYLVQFFANHGFLESNAEPAWRTIVGGSRSYLEPIQKPFAQRVRTGTPVRALRRFDDRVEVSTDSGTECFDHVVVAAHGDQALRMLADPSPLESQLLGAIRYQPNETVLHTDASVLPRSRRAWASWNYTVPREKRDRVAITYYSNLLQSIESPSSYCVTLNRTQEIRPDTVLESTLFEHPVYSFAALEAQRRASELNGQRRTSYCGAYWGYGFHEDGVQSAIAATRAFGVEL